jgi:hypothetical protein
MMPTKTDHEGTRPSALAYLYDGLQLHPLSCLASTPLPSPRPGSLLKMNSSCVGFTRSKISAMAAAERGTRCSRAAFIRSARTIHMRAIRSISAHRGGKCGVFRHSVGRSSGNGSGQFDRGDTWGRKSRHRLTPWSHTCVSKPGGDARLDRARSRDRGPDRSSLSRRRADARPPTTLTGRQPSSPRPRDSLRTGDHHE